MAAIGKTLRGVLLAGGVLIGTAFADVRVVGSDLLGLEFSRAFYGFSGRHGIKLALAFDGSRSGLAALESGRADLGLMVLPPDELSVLSGYRTLPFGFHRVLVLVPVDCPLEEISFAQLAGIFAGRDAEAGGNFPRWSELGAVAWGEAPVKAFAPDVGTGVALEYFRRVVLQDRTIKTAVARYARAADLSAEFKPGSRAIALAAAIPPNASCRALRVARSSGGPSVPPTPETLASGNYPLCLPVQMVFRRERGAAIEPLLEFLFGDEAARQLEAAEIAPLPAAARAAQRAAIRPARK